MANEADPWMPREKNPNATEFTSTALPAVATQSANKPDGGWGWMVCVGTFLVNFIVFGIHNSFGVIYANLLDELHLGEAETAWIGAMAMGLNFLCGPIASALCDRFGCRPVSFVGAFLSVLGLFLTSFIQEAPKMYVTYGLVWGVGSSLCFVPSIIMLGEYFDKRLALVNGIGTSGSGVGGLIANPVINYMLETVGWKNSMRFLSGVAALLWIASLLYRPVPASSTDQQQNGQRPEKKKLFDTSMWRNKAYVMWVSTVALFQFGYLIPFVHLVRYAEVLGIPKSKGAWLIGFLSIMSSVGRVFFGKLCDLECVNRLYIYQFSIFAIGVCTMLCPLAESYSALTAYAIVFGFFDGCFVGQVAVITADVVGHEKLSQAVGNMFGALALPMSFGPPVAGWLYQEFQSYKGAFYVSGAVAIVSSSLIFIVAHMIATQSRDKKNYVFACCAFRPDERRSDSSLSTSDYSSSSKGSNSEIKAPLVKRNDRDTEELLIELKDNNNTSVWYSLTKRDLKSALLTVDKETVL